MRKSHLTRQYTMEPRPGTLSMVESKNFFASKVLEIPDVLDVDQRNITWIQSQDNTQGVNLDDQTKSLNVSLLKQNNQSIELVPDQPENEIKRFTQWRMKINVLQITKQWIFANLKRESTFARIRNSDVRQKNIDDAILAYIDQNIVPRIKFETIKLYVKYSRIGGTQDQAINLQNNPTFDESIITPVGNQNLNSLKESLSENNFSQVFNRFTNRVELTYKQTRSSSEFKFDYYFDVIYRKA